MEFSETYTTDYRFSFNGKECDSELKGTGNSLDFGARLYDPRLGRWLSIDPLHSKFPQYSPCNFVADNPVIAIDPDGKDIYIVTKNTAVRAGKSTMIKTQKGKEIWNKYAASKTTDVYITSQKWTQNSGMAAGTLNHAEKALVNEGKINVPNNEDFSTLQGLDVSKSNGRQISLISINESFAEKSDRYSNAKNLFHEFISHVDNPNLSEVEGHKKIGILGYEPAKGKPGYFNEKVLDGSVMDVFNKELRGVIKNDIDKAKQNE